jgi:hypothetical protein
MSTGGPDPIGVYGAVLSTLVAAWQAMQWWVERSRIDVECYLAKRVGNTILPSGSNVVAEGNPPPGWLPDHLLQRFIAINVKNTGGKPIVIQRAGGHLKNGHVLIGLDGPVALPHALSPGDAILLTLPLPVDLQTVMSLDHIKDIGVWDGLGRFRRAGLRALKVQYAVWIAQQPPNQNAAGE